jgi:CRP/FNR family transcriptional regulator, cyclic AMP receptor protein
MIMARQNETLSRIGLFRSLMPDEISRLDTRCIWRRANAKEWILDYEDESTDIFFLISGVVRVMIRSVSGRETILRDINAGEFFGELAAIDGQARSASILAITEATIAKMAAATFLEVVTSHPDICLQMLRLITGQVRMLANRINEFTTLGIRDRLYLELLRLSRPDRENVQQAIVSPPPPSCRSGRANQHAARDSDQGIERHGARRTSPTPARRARHPGCPSPYRDDRRREGIARIPGRRELGSLQPSLLKRPR